MHLYESRLCTLWGTVAKGFAQVPKSTDDVQVQLSSQLSKLYPHNTLTPHHPLLSLQRSEWKATDQTD